MGASHIVFLGTAGDSHVMCKQLRSSAGIVLQHDGMQFLINPGPGTLVRAAASGINLRETDAILVSRNTLLCANDVNACIEAMTNAGLDKKGVIVCSAAVLTGGPQLHPSISEASKSCVERIIPLKPGDKVALNAIEVIPTPTAHADTDNIGFRIQTHDFSVSYVADTRLDQVVTDAHKGADILILNIVSPVKKVPNDTLDLEDVVPFIKAVQPKLVVLTGFGSKMIEFDSMPTVRAIQQGTGVQIVAARDGLLINPVAPATMQQRLS